MPDACPGPGYSSKTPPVSDRGTEFNPRREVAKQKQLALWGLAWIGRVAMGAQFCCPIHHSHGLSFVLAITRLRRARHGRMARGSGSMGSVRRAAEGGTMNCPQCGHPLRPSSVVLAETPTGTQCERCWTRIRDTRARVRQPKHTSSRRIKRVAIG